MQAVHERLEAFRAEQRKRKEEAAKNKEKQVPILVEKPQPSPSFLEVLFNIDFLQWLPAQSFHQCYAKNPRSTLLISFLVYFVLQIFTYVHGFGTVFFIISVFVTMFLSLGQRKEGEASAYSVFNPGCERLPGQMTAEHFERDVLRRGF